MTALPAAEITAKLQTWQEKEGPTYHNFKYEDGQIAYRKRRKSPSERGPKIIPQYWDGKEWKNGLNGIDQIIYCWPELIEAVQAGKTIYFCEGEKDVDKLRALGFEATTTGGTSSIEVVRKFAYLFGGAEVVIIPDNDPVGHQFADDVARNLSTVADVSILTLPDVPEKGDVSDYLIEHSVEEFLALTPQPWLARASESGLLTTRLADVRSQQTLWVWNERVPLGELTLLVGAEGQGKSTLAIELASRLTRGQLDGDLKGQPCSVIYATSEDSASRVVRPRFEAAGADLERVLIPGIKGDPLTLSEHLDQLREIVTTNETQLVIIDPLVSALSDVDTYKAGPVRQVLENFRELMESLGVACLGVIHTNRNETRVVLDRISESKAFSRVARAAIGVGLDPNDDNSRLVAQIKNNLGRMDLPVLKVHIEGRTVEDDNGEEVKTSGLVWLGEAEGVSAHQIFSQPPPAGEQSTRKELIEAIETILQEDGEMAREELFKALKEEGLEVSDRTFKRALSQAKVEHKRSGYPSVNWYRYSGATTRPAQGFGGLTDVSRENTPKTSDESLSRATVGYVGPTEASSTEPQVIHWPQPTEKHCQGCDRELLRPDSIPIGICILCDPTRREDEPLCRYCEKYLATLELKRAGVCDHHAEYEPMKSQKTRDATGQVDHVGWEEGLSTSTEESWEEHHATAGEGRFF